MLCSMRTDTTTAVPLGVLFKEPVRLMISDPSAFERCRVSIAASSEPPSSSPSKNFFAFLDDSAHGVRTAKQF